MPRKNRAMKYKVTQTAKGWTGGSIQYIEDGRPLSFPYKSILRGIGISVPTAEQWSDYCERHSTDWAKGRREEILKRIGETVKKWYGELEPIVIMKNHLVIVSYERFWVVTWWRKMFS